MNSFMYILHLILRIAYSTLEMSSSLTESHTHVVANLLPPKNMKE